MECWNKIIASIFGLTGYFATIILQNKKTITVVHSVGLFACRLEKLEINMLKVPLHQENAKFVFT